MCSAQSLCLCGLLLAGPACGAPEDEDPGPLVEVDLVDPNLWVVDSVANDPLADHRPAEVDCAEEYRYPEGIGYEIDTSGCNYVSIGQSILEPIESGRPVTISLGHYDLVAGEPAVAHAAIVIGEVIVWETTVDIPGAASVEEGYEIADLDVPAGTPIHFHLHNHGYNTWQLFEVATERPAD